jgi:hypothetical protein
MFPKLSIWLKTIAYCTSPGDVFGKPELEQSQVLWHFFRAESEHCCEPNVAFDGAGVYPYALAFDVWAWLTLKGGAPPKLPS